MRTSLRAGLLLALVIPAAVGPLAAQKPKKPPRASQNLITQEQIQANQAFKTAWDAVSALHSSWLIDRPPGFAVAAAGGAPDAASDTSLSPSARAAMAAAASSSPAPPGLYAGIRVYLDGVYMGKPDELKSIPVLNIVSIRHYVGNEAQTLFGMGNSAGVIAVSTRPD